MFLTSPILERFIVIEGIDGAGTSTQRTMLCSRLAQQGHLVHETWEPTDSPVGKLIRSALNRHVKLSSDTLCRLFAADRGEHCNGPEGISARCARGEYVVSDRYVFSSYAYQGLQHPLDWIARLNEGFPLPEYLFFIDVDNATGAERRKMRGLDPDLFEEDPIQIAVRENYHNIFGVLSRQRPDIKLHTLDGSLGREELHTRIWSLLGFRPILGR